MRAISLSFVTPDFNDFSIIVRKIKRLSVDLFPSLPPCWMLPKIPASSIKGVSLVFSCYPSVVCEIIYITFAFVDKCMSPTFHALGLLHVDRIVLYSTSKYGAISSKPILKASFRMPSGPAAFLFLRFFSTFWISFFVIWFNTFLDWLGFKRGIPLVCTVLQGCMCAL